MNTHSLASTDALPCQITWHAFAVKSFRSAVLDKSTTWMFSLRELKSHVKKELDLVFEVLPVLSNILCLRMSVASIFLLHGC